MKKIAFFVEGLTEQAFIERLLVEIFSEKNISIEVKHMTGGASQPVRITQISTPTNTNSSKYYALIINCNGDGSIKSYILERRNSLLAANFSKVIGLLDVYWKFRRNRPHLTGVNSPPFCG